MDELRQVASKLDSSLLPTSNELPGLLGALIYHGTYGDKLTGAETSADVSELVSAPPEDSATAGSGSTPGSAAGGPDSASSAHPGVSSEASA